MNINGNFGYRLALRFATLGRDDELRHSLFLGDDNCKLECYPEADG